MLKKGTIYLFFIADPNALNGDTYGGAAELDWRLLWRPLASLGRHATPAGLVGIKAGERALAHNQAFARSRFHTLPLLGV
jgi:hypothetical protein